MHVLNVCTHLTPNMHFATPMIGVGGVAGAGQSGRGNKVGVGESNQDGVCCVAEAKRVVGHPVVGGFVGGDGSSGGFFDGLIGRRTLSGGEASVFCVVDCLYEVGESQDLVGRHLTGFDMALCIDAVCKAVPVNKPAGAHFALAGPRYASADILVCKSTSPCFTVLWLECVNWMLIDNAHVDLSFFLFLSIVFAFLFWGGNNILGLRFGRFGEGG